MPDNYRDSDDKPDEEHLQKLLDALQHARDISDSEEESRILLTLGEFYAQALEYQEAAQVIEQGLTHLRTSGQQAISVSPLLQLARIYRILNRNDRAFALFHEIVELAESLDNACALGYALANKGLILVDEGSPKNGLEFLFRGFQILEELKLPERIEVKEWLMDCRRRIPRPVFDQAVDQSTVSPKTKSTLKLIE